MPSLSWSVLEALRKSLTREGLSWLSIATSAGDRWQDGSKAESDGTVSSPSQKKPKKAVEHAAHNMM